MSQVNFVAGLHGVKRIKASAMRCHPYFDRVCVCVFVCVSTCEPGVTVKGGKRRGEGVENKHILRCVSSASTRVRPSAC